MAGFAGTISFKHGAFPGTPNVFLQEMRGTLSLGAPRRIVVVSRYSGSFTWAGSPRHGTFGYIAFGSYLGPS